MNVAELERLVINLNREFDRDRVEAWEYFCDIAPYLVRRVIAAEKLVEALRLVYGELLATVEGECPSLVNEDSGASNVLLEYMIDAESALRAYEATK